jgi:uncharacterized protein YkwD
MQFSTHIRTVLCVFVVASALVPAAQATTLSPTTLSSSERTLLATVNDVRAAHNLRPLQVDPTLVRAARDYSATLIRRDVFTHGALGPRLARYGARGPLFGENLAWGKGERASARSIVRSWLASPGHRANLLRPGWTRIGIGARTGSFLGHDGATVVTADFAG